MISTNISSNSKINAKVELYNGSTLVTTCTCADILESLEVERYGEDSKFFGSCIPQRLKLELIDMNRTLYINKSHSIKVYYVIDGVNVYPYPTFYVEDAVRSEDGGTVSVTAHDSIVRAEQLTLADINLPNDDYMLGDLVTAIGNALGIYPGYENINLMESSFSNIFENGANFNGKENLREILKQICEYLNCFCFIKKASQSATAADILVFKRLNAGGSAVLTIGKADYFELKTEVAQTLTSICFALPIEGNDEGIVASLDEPGVTQYIRNNAFLEAIYNREGTGGTDVAALLNNGLNLIGGTYMAPFYCDWAGNCLLEIGDKIALTTDGGVTLTSYVLNDKVIYDGTYNEITEWSYKQDAGESASNSTSLGEVLNETFIKVDKQEKTIKSLVSSTEAHDKHLSTIQQSVDSINGSVISIEEWKDEITGDVGELTKKTELMITDEDVTIKIQNEVTSGLANGTVNKVTTTAGFTFNEEGLAITKDGAPTSTQITENGMTVYNKDSREVLKANNNGVWAIDLHATTYLKIGVNSRFEDYNGRTGCFWIGG